MIRIGSGGSAERVQPAPLVGVHNAATRGAHVGIMLFTYWL